jgi:large conductance mechanosensitive channel
VDFLIIAFSIFLAIKMIQSRKKKDAETEEVVVDPAPSKEEVLLGEIRDILKEQR